MNLFSLRSVSSSLIHSNDASFSLHLRDQPLSTKTKSERFQSENYSRRGRKRNISRISITDHRAKFTQPTLQENETQVKKIIFLKQLLSKALYQSHLI